MRLALLGVVHDDAALPRRSLLRRSLRQSRCGSFARGLCLLPRRQRGRSLSSRIVLQATVSSLEGRRNEADILFDKLDTDSDGTLTLTELKRGIGKIRSVTGMEMKARQILVSP